jgi:hypothetical protein
MNQNEIIEMARQAYENCDHIPDLKIPKEFVEAFAKLVAAKEREACAILCDDLYHFWTSTSKDDLNPPNALDCKRAIRARGEA